MGGCLKAAKAEGRNRKLARATTAPIAKVMAASWKAGIFPVATVNTASSDHIRIAERPIRVAVRGDIGRSTPSWPGLARPSTSFLVHVCKDVDALHKTRHDDNSELGLLAMTGPAVTPCTGRH